MSNTGKPGKVIRPAETWATEVDLFGATRRVAVDRRARGNGVHITPPLDSSQLPVHEPDYEAGVLEFEEILGRCGVEGLSVELVLGTDHQTQDDLPTETSLLLGRKAEGYVGLDPYTIGPGIVNAIREYNHQEE